MPVCIGEYNVNMKGGDIFEFKRKTHKYITIRRYTK